MKKAHVVIIGGGFGGTYTARYLQPLVEAGDIEVTLINRTNYFLFTPLLHEVATGGLSPTSVVEPLREIFRHECVHVIQEEVTSINPLEKTVVLQNRSIGYDFLVISSGAETNYYNTPGAREHTLTLKNLQDAQIIRKTIIDACEKGAHTADDALRKKMLSCVVVGGGATGVELAAEIVELMQETLYSYYQSCHIRKVDMQITLVSASPELLPPFPPKLREIAKKELVRKGIRVLTGEAATEIRPGRILFKDGSFLEAGIIIWVAGVKPVNIELPGVEKENNGRIKIDEYLRTVGSPEMFALGDVSGTAPMLAQIAAQQAKTVAYNIGATMKHIPLVPFKFHEKGLLISLGQWYAAGRILGLTIQGPMMWLLWRLVYLFNFHSFRKRCRIIVEWTVNLFYPRDITEV